MTVSLLVCVMLIHVYVAPTPNTGKMLCVLVHIRFLLSCEAGLDHKLYAMSDVRSILKLLQAIGNLDRPFINCCWL